MNQPRIFVKPTRTDVTVRNETTLQPIAVDGESVPDTTYYRRRVADGDLQEVEPPPASSEAPLEAEE